MEARYLTDLEWRICHAINIYVYRNGMDGESPILVHIPPAKKKNMKTVLNAIEERVAFAVGYPTHLYRMDGKRVRHPCELEQYSNYVVASNYDKYFKCVQYGRKKSPLLVLNRDSKHIRVLRLQNSNYRDWIMKKEATVEERPFAPHFYPPYANENSNVSNTKVTGREGSYNNVNNAGQSDPTGAQTYRVSQQNPDRSQPQQPYQKDYVVQQCDVVTDNPQANQTLTRLQERGAPVPFGSHRTQYPTDLPKSEPFRTSDMPNSLKPEEPPLKKVQSLPEAIIDPYEQYRLPLPPSEFSKQQYITDKVNSNVPNGNPAGTKTSYENLKDMRQGIHSDGGSSSIPNESSSTSYEDLHEHNKYLLKQTRRKDRKLRKMFERNSSLMLAKGQATQASDCSETDLCSSVAIKETSRKDISFKASSRSKHLLVLPPPPPQFRDEIKLMLENSTGVVDKISFFVSQNQT